MTKSKHHTQKPRNRSRELTQSRLKELLHYDPETGVFTWKVCPNNTAKRGDVAGYNEGRGYLEIRIDKRRYKAHRLVFLYVYGDFPVDQIDHIDGNKKNNAIKNLRECNHSENQQNRKLNKNSTSKLVGASWDSSRKKWQSGIMLNRKKKHLGRFDTKEAAHEAYCKAKAELHTFNSTPRDPKKNLAVRLGGAA